MKDKLIGVIVTMLTFLAWSYFAAFETLAGSESKYSKLDKKISLVLCYMDKKHCINQLGVEE